MGAEKQNYLMIQQHHFWVDRKIIEIRSQRDTCTLMLVLILIVIFILVSTLTSALAFSFSFLYRISSDQFLNPDLFIINTSKHLTASWGLIVVIAMHSYIEINIVLYQVLQFQG